MFINVSEGFVSMCSQINSVQNNKYGVFAPFRMTNGADYAIIKPFGKMSESEEFKKVETEKQEKKSNKLGVKIATIGLTAGFGVFLLMKGLPKSSYKKVNDAFKKLEDKIYVLSSNTNLSKIQTAYLYSLKGAKKVLSSSKALFNIGPLKDVAVRSGMNKVPLLHSFDNWITGLFEKIAVTTCKNSYVKTMGNFDDLFMHYSDLNKSILGDHPNRIVTSGDKTQTAIEWVKELNAKTVNVQENYHSDFLAKGLRTRLDFVDDGLKNIFQDVLNRTFKHLDKFAVDKKTYTTFMSEELAAPTKIKLVKMVEELRGKITNDISDNYTATKKILSSIDDLVNPADKNSRDIMRNISKHLDEYKNLSGKGENSRRDAVVSSITEEISKLQNTVKEDKNYSKIQAQFADCVQGLNEVLQNRKKGELQEILTIYKKLLPESEYQKIKALTYKTIKSFDNSIDMETDRLFDKRRDFKIGSAPMDALSVLTSLGIVGWGLTKADSKQERISVSLKYGIPVVGAVATSLYCTARLVAGGKALILGLLSGMLINKVGVGADNVIKKYNNQELKLNVQNLIPVNPLSSDDEPAA